MEVSPRPTRSSLRPISDIRHRFCCDARTDTPNLLYLVCGHWPWVSPMRRREFITLIVGATAAWPLAARGQQPERTRRIGMLMNGSADDPEAPARIAAFAQGLQETGWTLGRNVRIDYRWGAGDSARYRKYAEELVSLGADVLVGFGSATAAALKASGTKPVVFLSSINQMPAVFSDRVFIADGGLVSYGPDRTEQFRRAADYVNRILRGENAADLPVQAPTKYELVINLKTAKALGLTVPPTLLARVDEVIE